MGPIILKKKNPKTKNNESPILNFNFYILLFKCLLTVPAMGSYLDSYLSASGGLLMTNISCSIF